MFPTLRNRKVQIIGQTLVIGALVGGTAAFVGLNKSVELTVDGETEQVRTFGTTVEEVLDSQDIALSERDDVSPAADTSVERGMAITVGTAKQVALTIDGKSSSEWTTAATVGQALADLGVDAGDAEVSKGLEDKLQPDSDTIEVQTNKPVSVIADGKTYDVESTVGNVSDTLDEAGVKVEDKDVVTAPLTSPVIAGQVVKVLRYEETEKKETKKVDFETTVKNDDSLYEGETKNEKAGKAGETVVTYAVATLDGEEVSKKKTGEEVKSEPVDAVVLKGTKKREAPKEDSGSSDSGSDDSGSGDSGSGGSDNSGSDDSGSGDSGSGDSGSGGGSAPTTANFERLAKCESGGDWKAVNPAGPYYGGLQFSAATWKAQGGKGLPHEASKAEQIRIGKKLQKAAGWGQWPSCSQKLGLR